MVNENIKQWLRNKIASCVLIQDDKNNIIYFYYDIQYLRANKLSKIIDVAVNPNNFKINEPLFWLGIKYKKIYISNEIREYIHVNYSCDIFDKKQLLDEVFNDFDEYKGYNCW